MAETNIVGGLFGMTPEALQAQQFQQQQDQALLMAKMSPFERANYGMSLAGSQLGSAIPKMFGYQDPQMAKASMRQQVATSIPFDGSSSYYEQVAKQLAANNDQEGAALAIAEAQKMKTSEANARLTSAKAAKEEMTLTQEQTLRDELAKLGPEATNEQVLSVVTKYGSPDKVLATLQASADRQAQRDMQVQQQRERLDQQLMLAREAGANRAMIAQMAQEGRNMIAQMQMNFKMQDREEKIRKEDEQRVGAITSFDSAMNTLNKIDTHPGKKAAVGTTGKVASMIPGTDAAGFASQLDTFKAQVFLPQVQNLRGMGALSNAEGERLTNAIGALSQNMPLTEFNNQIKDIRSTLEAAKKRAESTVRNKEMLPQATTPTQPKATKRFNPTTGQLEEVK
jgi:hypothetical protein